MTLAYFEECQRLAKVLEEKESQNMSKAAAIIAKGIMNGGIIQSFGSGHSYAAALEVSGRAGGLIPSKVILDPANGLYERSQGVGKILTHRLMIEPNDIFVLISNSGRNPMSIEIAAWVKEHGNPLIVVTALESSKLSSSRHPSGKLLYEFADVVLDNHSTFGDSALEVEGLDSKVCGTSSFSATLLLQQTMYEAFEIMSKQGFEPPIYKSANVDGGPEYNEEIEKKYANRIFHI